MINYSLPSNLDKEISELSGLISKFKEGRVSDKELKAHRVPFGIYEQRQPGTYMVRVRCAGGCVSPEQLISLAKIAKNRTGGMVHITTRQEIQIHNVILDDIIGVIKELKTIGLVSRGGGGNTVRNIITDEEAGISEDEAFDVTPYAISLTTRMIAEFDSWTLPRKFKIAFSGSQGDRGCATAADLGFIAVIRDGNPGFKVFVAGGFGRKAQEGKLLFEFLPAEQVYNLARSVKTLFYKYGNRKNKHSARLRFLWRSLGRTEFIKLLDREYDLTVKENYPPLKIEEIQNKVFAADIKIEDPVDKNDFDLWYKRFVKRQKQKGLFAVLVPVPLGFISSDDLIMIGGFFKLFGDNVIRMTKDQNFLLRNIAEKYLGSLYNFLKGLNNFVNQPVVLDRLVSCAGASTCQLGICLSRNAAIEIKKALRDSPLNLDLLSNLKINISGCPNSCGQHPLADLGFYGKVLRKAGKLYPAYNVVAGALINGNEARYAETVGEISARDLPCFVREIIKKYLSKSENFHSVHDYFQREAKEDIAKICDRYKDIPLFEEDKNYYFDWGSDKIFSLAGRGAGECSAGLFDLIKIDLENIKNVLTELGAKRSGSLLYELVFYSSRMLLISRGIEPSGEKEIFDLFRKAFIDSHLVDKSFSEVLTAAQNSDYQFLQRESDKVHALAHRVMFLYERMDSSFNFNLDKQDLSEVNPRLSSDLKGHDFRDLRGVACPMNFVKVKTYLVKLKPKERLEIFLDDGESIENIPGSVKEEGHKIIHQKKIDDYWSVIIEKV